MLAHCSGALLLAKLGLLDDVAVCADLTTRPSVIEAGANVVDRPFHASGNLEPLSVACPASIWPPG